MYNRVQKRELIFEFATFECAVPPAPFDAWWKARIPERIGYLGLGRAKFYSEV